jgi:hypothetical protein
MTDEQFKELVALIDRKTYGGLGKLLRIFARLGMSPKSSMRVSQENLRVGCAGTVQE